MKRYVLYGECSGELYANENIVEFYKTMVEIKKTDKENNIQDTYYCEMEIENGNSLDIYDIKVFRRGNKVFVRGVK